MKDQTIVKIGTLAAFAILVGAIRFVLAEPFVLTVTPAGWAIDTTDPMFWAIGVMIAYTLAAWWFLGKMAAVGGAS